MKMKFGVVVALAGCVAFAANTGNCSASPLDTIVPLGIGAEADAEQVAAALRTANEKAGLRRFMLHAPGHSVRLTGCYDTDGYRAVGRRVKAIQDLVKADGIEVGYLMGPTMNAGCNLPWPAQIQKDGSACPHRPCPGDPAFQRDFAEHCAAVAAECKPFLYMMEDDYKYFITGCLCEEHLRRFGSVMGRTWTRETLLTELAKAENAALRVAWDDFLMEDLYSISRQAEKAIHAVSPETRIGLSVPGALRTDRAAKLARVLAGPKHRPFCRWQGALYGYDKPIQMPERLFEPIWAYANVADGIESYYEADNCPGTAYYGSGAALVGMSSVMLSCGYDGLWYWAIRGGTTFVGTQGENPCLKAYARSAVRLAAIRAEGRKGSPVGVCVPCNTAVQLIWPFGATNGRNCDRDGWARYLGLVGLPYTAKSGGQGADRPTDNRQTAINNQQPTASNQQPACYSGIWAFEGMSDDEVEKILSGPVFLDGEAAEALTARGFAHLIGVTGERRGKIDFTGEQVIATGRLIGSSFHQNYGLDGSTVTRLKNVGAEAVSVYYSGKSKKVVQPSVTRFVNAKGGRIVVMALDLAYAKATNLYNDGKRDLIIAMFDWLGGAAGVRALPDGTRQAASADLQPSTFNLQPVFPVRTDGDVLVMLTANEDAARTRLFVHAYNLCGDARDGLSFVVTEPYRGGEVEILDGAIWRAADCSWKDNRLTVRAPLHLFDTMVLRLKRRK